MRNTIVKTLMALAAGAAFIAAVPANAGEAAPDEALVAKAREIVGRFSEELKSRLASALKSQGPVQAIEICKVAAPAVATEMSKDFWTVRRTALKLRNAQAAPDAWEKQTLESFEAEKAKGADVTKLERAEIVDAGGVRTFRYMKAIPTAAEPCLACHGGSIAEPVKAKLAELYPQDRATGFNAGDIRGAFTLSKPLK